MFWLSFWNCARPQSWSAAMHSSSSLPVPSAFCWLWLWLKCRQCLLVSSCVPIFRIILYRCRWLLIKASLCRQPSVASVYHSLEVHLSCEGVAEKTWELSKVISAHSPLLRCLDGSPWLAGQAVEGGGDGTLKGSRPYMGSTRPWSVPLNPSHLGT